MLIKKSGIIKVKGEDNRDEIQGYPIINDYKYLGIIKDNKNEKLSSSYR